MSRRQRQITWSAAFALELQEFLETYLNHPRIFIDVNNESVAEGGGINVIVTINRLRTESDGTIARNQLLSLNENTGAYDARSILAAKMQSPFAVTVGTVASGDTTTTPPNLSDNRSSSSTLSTDESIVVFATAAVLVLLLIVVFVTMSRRKAGQPKIQKADPFHHYSSAHGAVYPPELRTELKSTVLADPWHGWNKDRDPESATHYYPTSEFGGRQSAEVLSRGLTNAGYLLEAKPTEDTTNVPTKKKGSNYF